MRFPILPRLGPSGSRMAGVVVTDHFSAEMASQRPDSLPVGLELKTRTRGSPTRESFETRYRIAWYVGSLDPGELATLTMLVWTRENPSSMQEYTSPGTCTLNSGPTAKWFDEDGRQFSSQGRPLYVTAK